MKEKKMIVNEGMKIEFWNVDDLVPNPRNSKTHSTEQIDLICRMMNRYGWTNPILIADGDILAGHGRQLAARKLGLKKVPCLNLSHLNENERKAYIIADNRSAETGSSWDLTSLKLELDDLALSGFDTSLTGFSDADYAELFSSPIPESDSGSGDGGDPDATPEITELNHSKEGDLWQLGPHKLYCGDSTQVDSWVKLMTTEKADACWTDPPYNVDFESELAGNIKNDKMADDKFLQFLTDALTCSFSVMKPGACIYVAHADVESRNFREAFTRAGFKFSVCLIWKKNIQVQSFMDYQSIHEPILYGWKKGSKHRFHGGRKQTTFTAAGFDENMVIENSDGTFSFMLGENMVTVPKDAKINLAPGNVIYNKRPVRSPLHPTTKPVELIEKQLKNSTRLGDIVIDGFGGSGSTLMACERLGLCARLIELDPKFVDVIIKRYQDYTGREAINVITGKPFPVKPGEGGTK